MESKQSSISIWTRSWIYDNPWYWRFLGQNNIWGLYWSSTDFEDVHRLFKIPYDDIMHILYVLSHEMNLSYQDMNQMPFFEILKMLDVYKEYADEQKKQNDIENNRIEQQMSSMKSQYNQKEFQKLMNSMLNTAFKYPNNFNTNFPKI